MRRVLWWKLTLCLLLLITPNLSWAHAYLVKSSPPRRAVLSAAPARVVLWFNERLEAQFSQISVWNAEGQQVDVGDMQVGPDDGKRLSVGLPTLTAGTYTVKFRVLSVDGHIVEAGFPFTVRSRP
jgi:methionine-rich copper-binding protein CopC